MKIKTALILLAVGLVGSVNAQFPMLQQGNEWYYNVYCLLNYQCGYVHYNVQDEITVGGHTGHNVSYFALQETGIEEIHAEILRQSNDTVYRYSEEAGIWHMLYDFGAQPGDVWEIQTDTYVGYGDSGEPEIFKVLVDATEEITIGQNTHRVVYTSAWNDNIEISTYHFGHNGGRIIEGIGPVDMAHGLTGQSINEMLPLQNPSFACFMANGELVYGSSASPCYALNNANPEGTAAELNLYPNPVTDVFFITLPENAAALQLYSADGRLQNEIRLVVRQELQQFSISDLSAGFYLVKALDAHGAMLGQRRVVKL